MNSTPRVRNAHRPRWRSLPRPVHHLSRCLHRHFARPHPQNLLRSRLRLPSRLVARRAGGLAPRSLLSPLGAQPQLCCRRTALRLLSAPHVDAGRSLRPHLSLEGRRASHHLLVPRSHRPCYPHARAPAESARRRCHASRMRSTLLRILDVHRLRAIGIRRTRRWLLDPCCSFLKLFATATRSHDPYAAHSTARRPCWRW